MKKSSDKIEFDLKQLGVDSVYVGNQKAGFSRIGERLRILLGKIYENGDTFSIKVYYKGIPASDPSGWGGFYFSGDYAFNLGVGFAVYPHSFGRAWFPCVDEFTMKTTYDFRIETDTAYTAACNGLLISETRTPDARIWHYRETVPMSAYLVSVSVSRFSVISSTYNGLNGNYPIQLYSRSADTAKVKTSFEKLPLALQAFEQAFGIQAFSKVGYNFVPFSSGAMEHAGNITYPQAFANGSFDYETLMAHELSHHWWGNNATCSTEGDMWLNEGWASYCEHFFNERIYGREAYRNSILQNHLAVLRFAHIRDANVFSLVGIPKEYTYGSHVYKKGADVIHSLRGVMGDSLFFEACRAYQNTYRLGNASTKDMENVFAAFGKESVIRAFFSNLVFEKGFPHAYISRQVHSGDGPFRLKIITEQTPRFTDKYCKELPVEVFFFKADRTFVSRQIVLKTQKDSFEFDFDFKPVFVCLDYHEKLSDAITDRTLITAADTLIDLPETLCRLNVNGLSDTGLFRIEHHWVGPEKYRSRPPYMSNYRYYTLDGIWQAETQLEIELQYDGRQGGAGAGIGYLDHTLIYKTEDSLTVLYRAFPGDHWRVWPDLQFIYGSKNDKQGKVLVKNAQKGDYVLAMYDHSLSVGIKTDNRAMPALKLNPVPVNGKLMLELTGDTDNPAGEIHIINASGQTLIAVSKPAGKNGIEIDTSNMPAGIYTVCLFRNGVQLCSKILKTN